MRRSRRWLITPLILVFAAPLVSCIHADTPPTPESVLEGVWEVQFDPPPTAQQVLYEFNSRGRLIEITIKVDDFTTITIDRLRAGTDVDGDAVTISASFFGGSTEFAGTLNADATEMTGVTSTSVSWLGVTISVENGTATFIKQ